MIRLQLQQQRGDFALSLDLSLPGSGVSAIIGPSGAGKTTLLRCIAGLERASQGLIEVNGTRWQDSASGLWLPPHQRRLGYVFQEASLFAHLNVQGNLDYGRRRNAKAASAQQREQIIGLLGIEHLLQRDTAALSGGERQRVGIARALLSDPQLLLMDEPLTALDPQRKADILPYLERLHQELSIPILYVSHSADEVARLADHLLLLEQGQVRASGPLQTLLPRLDLPMAYSDDARSLLQGHVSAWDETYQLLTLTLDDSALQLRIPHSALPIGQPVRVAVQARDVSLTLQQPQQSSVLNLLPARIEAIEPAEQPAQALIRLDLQGSPLLARVTRYSVEQLGLQPGQPLWAQIKGVALN